MAKWQRSFFQPVLPLGEDGRRVTGSKEHIALSRMAAGEGMVLLKNEKNALPIRRGTKVALFGKGTVDYVKGGGGSGDVTVEYIRQRVESLCEHNPMLGHRGCRLGNTYPEITEMQTRAILGAAVELKKEGFNPQPEIMVPLTGILYEFEAQEKVIRDTAAQLFKEEGVEIPFKVGTMIEIPRAALTANRIASRAEYFSFGTNDLTQMTFGYSRDDIASFLPVYLEKKILKVDPFQVLDQNGVGQLVEMAVEKGRSVRPELKCGICGEHGGEPSSVKFCHRVGLNYVSCSPFRVPIARLAAAQAAIE